MNHGGGLKYIPNIYNQKPLHRYSPTSAMTYMIGLPTSSRLVVIAPCRRVSLIVSLDYTNTNEKLPHATYWQSLHMFHTYLEFRLQCMILSENISMSSQIEIVMCGFKVKSVKFPPAWGYLLNFPMYHRHPITPHSI